MTSHFCLSLHFLDRAFHGIGDGGEREWPPSPLRVFQALVAAAARRGAGELEAGVRLALEWMERQPAPVIVAPASIEGIGYRLSVPNNAMDIVARAWSRGNDSNSGDANPATHRTMKGVRPTLLLGDAVHSATPHLGQGAAMAIEDAVVLGEELGKDGPVGGALERFMARRFERAKFVGESSIQLGEWEQRPVPEADTVGLYRKVLTRLAEPI